MPCPIHRCCSTGVRSCCTATRPRPREFPDVGVGILLTASLRNPALLGAVDAARRTGTAQTVELHQTVPNETWHRVQVAPLAR